MICADKETKDINILVIVLESYSLMVLGLS